MSINDYLTELESLIGTSSIVGSYNLNIDRKTEEIVFVSGRLDFKDGSTLDFKEFVEETNAGLIKLKYGYNYRVGSKVLFRYDNAADPRAKALASFPHHKHLETGEIVDSYEMNLSGVLTEIEHLIIKKS
ncbi:MAG: hypothetical protein GWO38_27225 [Phycisphaerae bacterium]|nr:hypothetical protein [Phycisphaerae bacterium]NIX01481.1 hypothetical protein [Phycisphaerae bacterium]NIX31218.1 hypothetical protein [Phycisphaerae bacterium]